MKEKRESRHRPAGKDKQMKFKEVTAFTVFIGSMFFYEIFSITCTVLLLLSLTWIFRSAKELEKKGEL
ncbi:MAG: hypothetical protein J6K26_09445 [Lachnospiraceae bacterium]|nr:hypothetical protein [Lachnospiraceae bacterium]